MGITIIGTSAQDTAKLFGYSDQMALFNLLMITFSVVIKLMNSRWFLKINHKIKTIVSAVGMAVGFLMNIFARYFHNDDPALSHDGWGFTLCLVGCLFVGASCGLADNTILGFMKVFPSIVLSGYVCGSGIASMAGS